MASNPWNLNNIANETSSLLRYVPGDISGIKVPWVYVGMCFSSFCWHNEDHWTYSINYNHFGAAKTWYGVRGDAAEQFEAAMQAEAPELFEQQPDLLHQLVTLMSPVALKQAGVPVVRTDQMPGQFIVTFPRAYHGGFNTGLNFAEAVNFATCDWLAVARNCAKHYGDLKRRPVFSHEQIVMNMVHECARESQPVAPSIVRATLEELQHIYRSECTQRGAIVEAGLTDTKKVNFDRISEDERSCEVCQTICYMSAVVCPCNPGNLVCARHSKDLCDCPTKRRTLLAQYTVGQLALYVQQIQNRLGTFVEWEARVNQIKLCAVTPRPTVAHLQQLLQQATASGWQSEDACAWLKKTLSDIAKLAAEANFAVTKGSHVFRALQNRKVDFTREAISSFPTHIEYVQDLWKRLNQLPCVVEVKTVVADVIAQSLALIARVQQVIATPGSTIETLEELKSDVSIHVVQLEHVTASITAAINSKKWCARVDQYTLAPHGDYNYAVGILDQGVSLQSPTQRVKDYIARLRDDVATCDAWCQKTKVLLDASPDEELLATMDDKAPHLRTALSRMLKAKMEKSRTFNIAADVILNGDGNEEPEDGRPTPHIKEIMQLLARGKQIQVKLPRLKLVELRVQAYVAWQKKLEVLFLKKTSAVTLPMALALPSQKSEMTRIQGLRKQHKGKDRLPVAEYCICKKETSGFMICCELCEDWYHGRCVGFSDAMGKKGLRFLCPHCCTTRRPKLTNVENVLKAGNALGFETPEAVLLRALLAEAKNWEADTKEALNSRVPAALKLKTLLMWGDMLEITVGNNELKSRLSQQIVSFTESGTARRFCTCRRTAENENMIQCETCSEWFHWDCVKLDAAQVEEIKEYCCEQCALKKVRLHLSCRTHISWAAWCACICAQCLLSMLRTADVCHIRVTVCGLSYLSRNGSRNKWTQ